jgi:quercetin 2,3-dioxygenase
MKTKAVVEVLDPPAGHWVGDGFPVRSLFSYNANAERTDPFLLLDFAGPAEFSPAERPRGVGQHPHRGFETVTIVFEGEVAHRDSAGNGGTIGAGDVQWMTAAAGIIHEEFHSPEYTRRGGRFEMIQLWVNLPAKDKMSAPGYQALLSKDIPVVPLEGGAGTVRLIAGAYAGERGPARTFTPVNLWEVRIEPGKRARLELPDGHTAMVVGLHGTGELRVNGRGPLREAQLAILEREGSALELEAADSPARALILSRDPIGEPLEGYGPFVMNSRAEIQQAISDFNSGQFGRLG